MIIIFRKLSLSAKLILIGILPFLLLVYFSYTIYQEKRQKLAIMKDYIDQVEISAVLASLNESLGLERRYSYHYLLEKEQLDTVKMQRQITDSIINEIHKEKKFLLKNFESYTFLDNLTHIRNQIDSIPSLNPNIVIDFYTRAIYRLNTINAWVPPSSEYLKDVFEDLIGQRLLREMITTIGILRTNIYNALYTHSYMTETLMGSYGIYTMYKSYYKEFDLKASHSAKMKLDSLKMTPAFSKMNLYFDKIFTDFHFDSTYSADEWWSLSTEGISGIRQQQKELWKSVDNRLIQLYEHEKKAQTNTLFFMALAVLIVIILILLIIHSVRYQLHGLKTAARKISKGETGINLEPIPHGMLGSLSRSILQIEKNNLVIARAAGEIGKGNFDVTVTPRSEDDILAWSIKKMKRDLREFNSQRDKIQKETMALIHQRDEFFSMTSHELKTPITTVKAYTQLLMMDGEKFDIEQHHEILVKMENQINRLVSLINDLLDMTRLQHDQLSYNKTRFKLNSLIVNLISEMQMSYPDHRIIFQKNINVNVFADESRISQVIANLITNAVKYAPDSRDIIIRLDKTEKTVVCSVKDFGRGIREEEKDKIFERFYRISGENLHTYPGLGLGLYISKEIIQKHNGNIWFESEYGKGSLFYVELPLAES